MSIYIYIAGRHYYSNRLMRSMCQADIHFFLVSCMLHEQAVSVDPKVESLATTRTRTEHREEVEWITLTTG